MDFRLAELTEPPVRQGHPARTASAICVVATEPRSSKSTDYYLGTRTAEQAERQCPQLTDFRLYHKIPSKVSKLEELNDCLPLTVVYCTSAGAYWSVSPCKLHYRIGYFSHYPVCELSAAHNRSRRIYVDYGDRAAPKFSSMSELIRYYSLYFHLNPQAIGFGEPDVFPWWFSAQQEEQSSS